jgi:hypothetical protein
MEAIQEVLFENKQDIPDGVYLKLMNLLKPEATEFYEFEYSILTPSIMWNKEDCGCGEYNVSVSPSHMKYNGGFSKMIIRLDTMRGDSIKEKIKSLTPFITYGYEIGQEINDRKNIRQSATIRQSKDVSDSEEDDDEGDYDEVRKIHISNHFFLKSCIWVSKITKM